MVFKSKYTKREYISALKEQMGSRWSFGCARFTGLFLGPLFSVTYHSDWEWNKKITCVKNSAIGYVKSTKDGCQVRYIHTKGLLYPSGISLVYFLILLSVFLEHFVEIPGFTIRENGGRLLWMFVLITVVTIIAALISAVIESFTPESEEGADILYSCIVDPKDPYYNI